MTVLGGIVMTLGIALSVLSAFGVWRFPTAIARMHAATKSASLGLALVVLGAGIASSSPGIVGIGLLTTALLFLTAPISGHLLGRASYLTGAEQYQVDALRGVETAPLEVEPVHSPDFSVTRWLGLILVWVLLWRDFSIGDARLGLGLAWPRCSMPQVDQVDGSRHHEPAKVLKAHRWCADASSTGDALRAGRAEVANSDGRSTGRTEVVSATHAAGDRFQFRMGCADLLRRSGLAPREVDEVAEAVDPRWVSPAALADLEALGLGRRVEDRVLGLVAEGLVTASSDSGSGLVSSLCEIFEATTSESPAELAELTVRLYGAHARLAPIAGDRWLTRLEELAVSELDPKPDELTQTLRSHLDWQWLLVDGLGIALIEARLHVDEALALPHPARDLFAQRL